MVIEVSLRYNKIQSETSPRLDGLKNPVQSSAVSEARPDGTD